MSEKKTHTGKALKNAGGVWRMQLMLLCYNVLGKPVVNILVTVISTLYFLTDKNARHYSKEYWKNLYDYQHIPYSNRTLQYRSLTHFISFGQSIVDKIDAWAGAVKISDLILEDPLQYEGILKDLNAGKGAMMIGSHLGNIEVLRAISSLKKGIKINVLMYIKHSKIFRSILKQVNTSADLNIIQVDEIGPETAVILQEKINQGELIIIAGDRVSISDNNSHETLSFLGKEAHFPKGPFILASVLRCPVFFVFCMKTGKKHHFILEKLTAPLHGSKNRQELLKQALHQYVKTLEKYCVRYPEQWYNFHPYWKEK